MGNLHAMAGRVGGFARAARYDGREMTAAARERFAASFRDGHACKVCPEVTLPVELLPEERDRRAEALRRGHYARVALASATARAKKKAALGGSASPARPEDHRLARDPASP